MTITNLEDVFREQVEVDMMIEVMLDWWEEGQEELPGLTKDYVRETIEYAASVDKEVKDALTKANEIDSDTLEQIFTNDSRQRRGGKIGHTEDTDIREVLYLLNIVVYALPTVKIVFHDFFNKSQDDDRYVKNTITKGKHKGSPYLIRSILAQYDITIHKMSDSAKGGTANYMYNIIGGRKDKEQFTQRVINWSGFGHKIKDYRKSFLFWFSPQVSLAREVLDDFFTNAIKDVKYHHGKGGGGTIGAPYSLVHILRNYDVSSHSFPTKRGVGTAASVYRRLGYLDVAQRPKAIEQLLDRTRYTQRFSEYQDSRWFWDEADVKLAKIILSDFLSQCSNDIKYRQQGSGKGKYKGEPYTLEYILIYYSTEQHTITTKFQSGKKLGNRLRIISEKYPQYLEIAENQLLSRTDYQDEWNCYLGEANLWREDEVNRARKVLGHFLAAPEDKKYRKRKRTDKNVCVGNPYEIDYVLRYWSIESATMEKKGDASSVGSRIYSHQSSQRQRDITSLLKATNLTAEWSKYKQSSINNPYLMA